MAGVFHMTVLGRVIEHLGTQMYKHRAPSIAELIANCWDAGANNVWVTLPEKTSSGQRGDSIIVMDDGEGMDDSTIEKHYLVIGRNRRAEDKGGLHLGRKVMGRKGIGKLAGFGLAEKVTVTTWTDKSAKAIMFSMSLKEMKKGAGKADDIEFPWVNQNKEKGWPPSGTRIELSMLRHSTPIDLESLKETLARRFSRTTRGEMIIRINELALPDPSIESRYIIPKKKDDYKEAILEDGKTIKYRYLYAQKPLRSSELQGFVIYANNRAAQAPPFFFNVESTASSQHSTRYVSGEIIADFLDAGTDDESDSISTDRQELDWEKEELNPLRKWGDKFTRERLRECAEMMGKEFENWILEDTAFSQRLGLLDQTVRNEISRFLKILGQKHQKDDERIRDLADSLIRAYEFQTFHDVIDDLNQIGDDPEKLEDLLGRLHDWKVLESRAILEIVKGRLSIIKKLEIMIISNAPETASSKTHDNLHDLLAEYPWIFNPEWQVFEEEKAIGKQLREWGERDCHDDMKKKRVDFLAFEKDTKDLVIIELKRPDHPVGFDEMQRLEQYQNEIMRARPNCRRVLVYGGTHNVPQNKWKSWIKADDIDILTWADMFSRAKSFYDHYESVLNGDVTSGNFRDKQVEVNRTRDILERGSSHRSTKDRRRGLGESQP